MKRVQIVCDRCGKEISGNAYRFVLRMLDDKGEQEFGPDLMPRPMPDAAGKVANLDYCPKCAAELVDLMGVPRVEPAKKAPKKPKEPAPAEETDGPVIKIKGRPMDMPKLRSLRNARWSKEKMAVEFSCSVKTIERGLELLEEEEKKGAVPNGI